SWNCGVGQKKIGVRPGNGSRCFGMRLWWGMDGVGRLVELPNPLPVNHHLWYPRATWNGMKNNAGLNCI
ncbi:MAG: hypothetical protein WCL11_23500, partial [Verrucomicrobiota bacterium]